MSQLQLEDHTAVSVRAFTSSLSANMCQIREVSRRRASLFSEGSQSSQGRKGSTGLRHSLGQPTGPQNEKLALVSCGRHLFKPAAFRRAAGLQFNSKATCRFLCVVLCALTRFLSLACAGLPDESETVRVGAGEDAARSRHGEGRPGVRDALPPLRPR